MVIISPAANITVKALGEGEVAITPTATIPTATIKVSPRILVSARIGISAPVLLQKDVIDCMSAIHARKLVRRGNSTRLPRMKILGERRESRR